MFKLQLKEGRKVAQNAFGDLTGVRKSGNHSSDGLQLMASATDIVPLKGREGGGGGGQGDNSQLS